jgi:hypothetical protein
MSVLAKIGSLKQAAKNNNIIGEKLQTLLQNAVTDNLALSEAYKPTNSIYV